MTQTELQLPTTNTTPPQPITKTLTKHQKAFAAWLASFEKLCIELGGKQIETGTFRRFEFQTRFGPLQSTVSELAYDEQTKRGWVEINSRFSGKGDLAAIMTYLKTHNMDFNRFSGKWNINLSGHKADLASIRILALDELKQRLALVAPI